MLDEERASRSAPPTPARPSLKQAPARVPLVRLPYIDAIAPEAVVAALSEELEPQLATLLPEGG
jgi:hypothetical protein